MITLEFDLKAIEQAADDIGGMRDQIPFVMAGVLNDAAFATRKEIVENIWPTYVQQRNRQFPSAVLRVDKANKEALIVALREFKETSAPLILHAEGGTREPQTPGNFAIPMPNYRAGKMGARGLRKDARAAAIIARTPKRALRITKRGIFRGEGGRLRLIFALRPIVHVKKDVPFYEVWNAWMQHSVERLFAPKMEQAMRTRRRR